MATPCRGNNESAPYKPEAVRDRQLGVAYALVLRGTKIEMVPTKTLTMAEFGSKHTVADLEALAVQVADKYLRSADGHLIGDTRQDLIAALTGDGYREALKYQKLDGTSSLLGYLSTRMWFRCTDWYRATFGDERKVTGPLRRDGRPQEEIDQAVNAFRTQSSLDVNHRDVERAISAEDEALVNLYEEGIAAKRNYEALMTDEDTANEVTTMEDLARVLGVDPLLLSDEAMNTLVTVAVPRANGESWASISEDTGMPKRKLEAARDQLAVEIAELGGGPE